MGEREKERIRKRTAKKDRKNQRQRGGEKKVEKNKTKQNKTKQNKSYLCVFNKNAPSKATSERPNTYTTNTARNSQTAIKHDLHITRTTAELQKRKEKKKERRSKPTRLKR